MEAISVQATQNRTQDWNGYLMKRELEVTLLGHTQLSIEFQNLLTEEMYNTYIEHYKDGQAISLSAIRTCYSPNETKDILNLEGNKYFNKPASDGQGGSEADRLIRHIVNSGHTSTLEHTTFTFAISGLSRSALAQLTRHRMFSFSVQSQRYVKFGSDDKSQGFDYIVPPSIQESKKKGVFSFGHESDYATASAIYENVMEFIQNAYDSLRECGVPAEDARMILPNAATCNLTMTGNLRSLLDFYSKRNPSTHAQWEISQLAEALKEAVISVEPWTKPFFEVQS